MLHSTAAYILYYWHTYSLRPFSTFRGLICALKYSVKQESAPYLQAADFLDDPASLDEVSRLLATSVFPFSLQAEPPSNKQQTLQHKRHSDAATLVCPKLSSTCMRVSPRSLSRSCRPPAAKRQSPGGMHCKHALWSPS